MSNVISTVVLIEDTVNQQTIIALRTQNIKIQLAGGRPVGYVHNAVKELYSGLSQILK